MGGTFGGSNILWVVTTRKSRRCYVWCLFGERERCGGGGREGGRAGGREREVGRAEVVVVRGTVFGTYLSSLTLSLSLSLARALALALSVLYLVFFFLSLSPSLPRTCSLSFARARTLCAVFVTHLSYVCTHVCVCVCGVCLCVRADEDRKARPSRWQGIRQKEKE